MFGHLVEHSFKSLEFEGLGTQETSGGGWDYPPPTHPAKLHIGVRGSLERDISSLRAFGPGVGQISRVVHVSARAPFGVFLREVDTL